MLLAVNWSIVSIIYVKNKNIIVKTSFSTVLNAEYILSISLVIIIITYMYKSW